MPFILTDGLLNSHVVLQADYEGRITTVEFTNETTEPQKVRMRLWDIIPDIRTGVYYVVNFKATATVSSIGTTVESDTVPVRFKVVSPSEITVSMGINGEDGDTPVPVPLSSIISYNFKIYGPTTVTSAYYSAKLVKGSDETLILGQYYDESLHEEGADSFTSNTLTYIETTISSQYYLSPFIFQTGDTLQLYIKAWDIEGRQTGETHMTINVIEASNDMFPQQYGTRGGAGYTAHTQFASWNAYNTSPTNRQKWVSHVEGYSFLDATLAQQENSAVTLNLEIKNANDVSGIVNDNFPPYMRIQNKAYATIDFTYYAAELVAMTNMRMGGNPDGFTISVCTESDEHSDNQHTLFLWGTNEASGKIGSGIRIDVDKAFWRVGDNEISCPISYGARNMLDFSYVRNGDMGTIRIYLNGVLNAAKDIKTSEFSMQLPNTAYIGASYRNGAIERFSDFNLYEISVYTKALNDLQLVVNSENARFTNTIEYANWKIKNFIYSDQEEPRVPKSRFFKNGVYIKEFDTTDINYISSVSNIPTLRLYFQQGSGFTEKSFYKKYDTSVVITKYAATAEYYDPNTNRETISFAAEVSLQGTTTLGYRVKNLELYVNEMTTVKGNEVVKLFQPKKEWFPESQFTLKADVVDSAHANNAVLGEWINNCGLMADNAVMEQFNDDTRPLDVDDEGTPYPHYKPGTQTQVYCDEDVTIKHTLEGFPILLFIYFDGGQAYNFIGIYSFNLGRHSYYNMGMKFLKCFSRRGANKEKVSCPKLINYYEEMDTLGTISSADVYSFEFGNDGNLQVAAYPVWSQYYKSVIQSYGEFKYPSVDDSNSIWDKLCVLFESVAKFQISDYYGTTITTFKDIYPYNVVKVGDTNTYVRAGDTTITQSVDYYQNILDHLHTGNTAAYFIIANAFGMTDSLGKNMTLRTWNNGEFWYPAFYDMDTALAIKNDGNINEAVDIGIDKIEMITEGASNILVTTYHDQASSYAAYLAKLWGVFRDSGFLYATTQSRENPYYERIWAQLRQTGGKLSTATNFTDIMAARVETCGEMIYDYDYNMKYIQDAEDTGGTESSINFLHGTRVEFVKDWLKRHLYYLDGVFDVRRLTTLPTFDDSPYYADIANIGVFYPQTVGNITYSIQVSTPTFLALKIGAGNAQKYYISNANTPTNIYYPNSSSVDSQLDINGSTLVTKMNGFQTGFRANTIAGVAGSLRSLSEFDASNSRSLDNNPFSTKDFILNNVSALETLNLSNTIGRSPLATYDVDLSNFNKVLNINISNSQVTSLKLPKSTLQTLNITSSKLRSFKMENQNKLTSVSFDGCNDLSKIELINCGALESINISDKPNLSTISILNCPSISAITISGCTALTSVEIGNNSGLKKITINNCTNINLTINLYGSTLSEIRLTNLYTTAPINLPNRSLLGEVILLDISNDFSFGGFKYGSEKIETYGPDDKFVFDLTPFTSLDGNNIFARNVMTICYIRVPNVQASPFNLKRNVIEGSGSVLRRVFGHILLTDNNMFKDCTNFYIREKVTDSQGKTPFNVPIWQGGDYATNITIATDSLNSCFEGTNCSLSDVYYIFNIAEDVITMTGTFASCKNVVTTLDDNLSPDLFTHTPNLENIDFLFNDGNIGGYISEDILIPIISGITTFNNVFGNNEGKSLDDKYKTNNVKCFFPEGNVIEEITGFNPVPYSDDQMFDNEMLRTLTEIKIIDRSFNDAMIDFGTSCELLQHATKLVSITTSFLRMKAYGSLDNIFGGKYVGNDKYPQALESITNSFSFLDSCDHSGITCPIIDDESHWGVLMPIGNSFLGKIKNTIKNIGGVDKNYRNSFYAIGGRGLKKYIDLDDCDGENFCYDIFRGCSNLEEIPNLFNGLDFGVTGKTFTYVDILYGNNGSMFSGLTKLKNVSGLFSGMKNVKYRLSGSAFKDCALEDASYIFAEGNESYHAKKIGQIPFKLFYEEATGSTQSSVYGISEATANALGITDGYVGPVAAEKFMFSNTYSYCRHTIKSLANAFEYSNSLEILPYSAQGTSFNDWVEDNVDYNPVKFYMTIDGENATYTLNPDYNPYKKVWNRYAYDGTVTEFNSMVVNSTEYQQLLNGTLVDDYGNPLAPTTLPDEFQPNYSQSGGNDGTISKIDTGFEYNDYRRLYSDTGGLFPIRNYLCAPDIFRYCANSFDTSISSIFQYGSPTITIDGCGIKGTIPPFIFEPISEIFEIQGVFSRCRGVLPYKWARYENGVKIEDGILYPPTMLSKLKNLYVFANVFSNTTVWGNAVCPEMFSENTLLSDINGLWSYATWVETVKPSAADAILQFPITLFTNNRRLTNVASLFSMGGPRKLEQSLFTYVRNPKINNCSGFLYRGSNVSSDSTVPTFWIEWAMSDFRNCYYGIDSNIISTQNIPERYWKELS